MRAVACRACKTVYHVVGEPDEVRHLLDDPEWGGSYPCITPLCRGRLITCSSSMPGSIDVVGIKDFYRAIHGFGRATNGPATLERSKKLLTTRRIVSVVGSAVGNPERTIIRELVLEDGTRLHFDRSSRGACLYYIEERGPSCTEVVENEIRSEGAAEGVSEDREEAGRAAETVAGSHAKGISESDSSVATAPEQPYPGGLSTVPETGDLPGSSITGAGSVNCRDPDMRV